MRTIKLGLLKTNEVKLFDSIKELSITRGHEFNKLILQDVGIGSDMQSVARHFSVMHNLVINDKKEELIQEMKNLNNNIYYMIDKINIRSFCFASFIHSINGEEMTDFSEENIKATGEKLSKMGLKQSQCSDIVDEVKKNLIQNFDPIFLIETEIPQPSTLLKS